MADNPYRPPEAMVADPVTQNGALELTNPKSLPAGRGAGWFKEAFGYFKSSPLIWILNIIILFAIILVLSLIPILGGLATNILTPIFTGGLMLGCAAQDRGEPLQVNHLFEGFKKNAGNLALVGLIYMAAIIVVVLIMVVLMGVIGGGTGQFAELAGMQPGSQPSPEQMQSMMAMGSVGLLIGMALIIPVVMAYFFAPALVVHHDLGAVQAMKLSFRGCLKNIVPFLIYGLVGLILAVIATIPFFLGWLVLAPVLTATMYVAYKDIFTQ